MAPSSALRTWQQPAGLAFHVAALRCPCTRSSFSTSPPSLMIAPRIPVLLRILPLLAAAVFAAVCASAASAPANPSGFVIRRGTNLSHWLSQDFGWQPRETWITANDLRFIAQCGFDHV